MKKNLFTLYFILGIQLTIVAQKANEDKGEAKLNKPLALQLESILTEDQEYRHMLDDTVIKYGHDSKEMIALWKIIHTKDSINLITARKVLDTYGWPDKEEVGERGNDALFFVIQYADSKIQELYFPMMREAAKKGDVSPHAFALLVDKVEMKNQRPQIYGTQIIKHAKDNTYFIYQITDEVNINKRRAEINLEPIEEYVKKEWNTDYQNLSTRVMIYHTK